MKHVTDQNALGLGLTILLVFIGMAFGWAANEARWQERLQENGLALIQVARPDDIDQFILVPVDGRSPGKE